MNRETELILEAYDKVNEEGLGGGGGFYKDPIQKELLTLLQPVVLKFIEDKKFHNVTKNAILKQLDNVGKHIQWIPNTVKFADESVTEAEKDAMRMEFVGKKSGKNIKLSTVRKVETDEWVVKVYINGKYSEHATYYTDDKKDALDTMKAMSEDINW